MRGSRIDGSSDGQASDGQLARYHPHNPNRYERLWGWLLGAVLVTLAAISVLVSFAGEATPPSSQIRLDPNVPLERTEFAEANLGVREEGSAVVARILAARFQFVPRCVVLPANRPIELRFTSADVLHGTMVAGTNANTMIVPGWVSVVNVRFPGPGDHTMPCHEFCGLGHNAMWARALVVPASEWSEGMECP